MAITGAYSAMPGLKRRPRVLQVVSKLDMGGAEAVALDLMSALHEHVDFAAATIIDLGQPSAVGHDMAARLTALQIPVFRGTRGHFKKGGVLQAAWRLAHAIRTFKPDLVHLHTEMPELTWALASVLFPGVRKVAVLRTVHNCELWIDWEGIGRWVTRRLATARVVAVSQAAAKADASIQTDASRPLAQVIYNGVAPPDTAARLDEKAQPLKILFAGRIIAQKGPDLLPAILAAAYAATARRNIMVTVAGEGPLTPGLREALVAAVPGWAVEVRAPIKQLSARLGEYDVVLMPSRYEGFGLLALETLLSGVPLVVTAAPGLDEVLPSGYPLVAEVDDVPALGALLGSVIADPTRMKAQVAAWSPGLAERFSVRAMATAYAAIYGLPMQQDQAA